MEFPIKIGIVTAQFNSVVTEKLELGALSFLTAESGRRDIPLELWPLRVPGAVEVPLACMELMEKGCLGVVALGAVIRGGTAHFEYVCQSVERGLTELVLRYRRPIGFGVLTVDSLEQAQDRAGGQHGNKGVEAAEAVLAMIDLQRTLRKSSNPEEFKRMSFVLEEAQSAKQKFPGKKVQV